MFIHYLRSAWRTILRNPFYSAINIGCLAIGIAVCMTVLLYVLHEHSFDRWQKNARRIYSLTASLHFGGSSFNTDGINYPTAPLIQQADDNVEAWLRMDPVGLPVPVKDAATPGTDFIQEKKLVLADSNFFEFFSFRLLRGSPAAALRRPLTVVITESAAKKYFGDKDPIGRSLRLNDKYNLEVTAIAADPPSNTDIDFNAVISMSSMRSMKEYDIGLNFPARVAGGGFNTWLLLKSPDAAARVEAALDRMGNEPGTPSNTRDIYSLTSLAENHLHSKVRARSDIRYLQIFLLAAGLILLLALVNYMSLATARATARAKEVGVRKVIGAGRRRIAGQFYTESTVFAVCSFIAGTLLFLLIRSFFFRWLQLPIDTVFLWSPGMLAFSGGLLAIVILTAGSYPSLVLSAFRPVAVLYGKMARNRGGERVRKGFIVFQFTISMTLILCSGIIEKELYFLRHKDTGMDRDNVIMIRYGYKVPHYAAFKRDIAAIPGIRGVATAQYPLYYGTDAWSVNIPGSEKQTTINTLTVDEDFVRLMGLQWKEPPLREEDPNEPNHVMMNEAAVRELGLPADPRGQRLQLGGRFDPTVAGILKDFNYESLQSGIFPLFLFVLRDSSAGWGAEMRTWMMAKITAHSNIPTIVDAIRKTYRRYDKQSDFDYSFADEAFDKRYKAEDRLAGLLGVFTVITIVIACLGLFALATFSAQQRVKEIGIRKVLGASVASIGVLLSKDFLRPVLLAVLIASPTSWWIMHRWLEDFAYRTSLSWWVFVIAALGLLGIALITVLMRSLRAGRANPAENLRAE